MSEDVTAASEGAAAPTRDDLIKQAIEDMDGGTPSPEVKEETTKEIAAAEDDTPLAAETEADPWAEAPETLRTKFQETAAERDKIKATWERQRNQTAGLTRKIGDLTRELEALKARPVKDEPADQIETALQTVKNDYPELAGPLEAISAKLREVAGQVGTITAAHEAAATTSVTVQEDALTASVPDWLDFMKTHGEAFFEWAEDQPRGIRNAVKANMEQIVDAAGVASAIAAFRETLTPPADPGKTEQARTDKRQRQLNGAASPAPRGGGAAISGAPADGDRATLTRWASGQVWG